MAKILFISDIHYSINDKGVYTDDTKIEFPHLIGTQGLKVLCSSIESIAPLDLVVFCGDIINGCDSFDEKAEAIKEVKTITDSIIANEHIFGEGVNPKDRIIFILGNHDMDRSNGNLFPGMSYFVDSFLSSETQKNVIHPYAPIFVFKELKLVVAAVPTEKNNNVKNSNIQTALRIIQDLTDENDSKRKELVNLLSPYSTYDIPSIDTETSDNFMEISRKLPTDFSDYFRIMVTHHPLLYGLENGIVVKKYGGTVGGYDLMQKAKGQGYSLFVHGHIHEKSCVEVIDHLSDEKNSIIQLGLPRTRVDSDGCGCVLVDVDVNEKALSCTLLKPDSISWGFKQIPLINYLPHIEQQNSGNKILVDFEIAEIIKSNVIVKNGDLNNVEAASYDCALGYEFKRKNENEEWKNTPLQKIVPQENGPSGILLKPRETILIFSYEEFDIPNDMLMHASPISSWLRLGVKFDISYFVDPGFKGKFCIPVTNENETDVILDARKPFISLEFIKLSTPCRKGWKEKHKELYKARELLNE